MISMAHQSILLVGVAAFTLRFKIAGTFIAMIVLNQHSA
jgi:hypothetical protein